VTVHLEAVARVGLRVHTELLLEPEILVLELKRTRSLPAHRVIRDWKIWVEVLIYDILDPNLIVGESHKIIYLLSFYLRAVLIETGDVHQKSPNPILKSVDVTAEESPR